MDKLSLDDVDNDTEDLFASPSTEGQRTQKHTPQSATSSRPATQKHSRNHSRQQDAESDRETRLRAELEQIRAVNKTIEGVTASLAKAQNDMQTVKRTVANAQTLLGTWTRILSQTEHNQRLVLNPNWHGAGRDLEEMEGEEVREREAEERRKMEEVRRREEAERKREEEEMRKAANASSSASGKTSGSAIGRRGSTRGVRGTRASQMRNATGGHTGVGGQAGRGRGTTSTTTSTRGSGIGRGSAGRGRTGGVG